MRHGTLWLIASLGVGFLQAWDSGAFAAGPLVAVLVLAGIVIPAGTLVMQMHYGLRIAALAVGAGLLTWARLIAPESLNTLHLALFPSALAILIVGGQRWASPSTGPAGPGN